MSDENTACMKRHVNVIPEDIPHVQPVKLLPSGAGVSALMRASGLAIRQTCAKPLTGEHCVALVRHGVGVRRGPACRGGLVPAQPARSGENIQCSILFHLEVPGGR